MSLGLLRFQFWPAQEPTLVLDFLKAGRFRIQGLLPNNFEHAHAHTSLKDVAPSSPLFALIVFTCVLRHRIYISYENNSTGGQQVICGNKNVAEKGSGRNKQQLGNYLLPYFIETTSNRGQYHWFLNSWYRKVVEKCVPVKGVKFYAIRLQPIITLLKLQNYGKSFSLYNSAYIWYWLEATKSGNVFSRAYCPKALYYQLSR